MFFMSSQSGGAVQLRRFSYLFQLCADGGLLSAKFPTGVSGSPPQQLPAASF
jgi:hypothetical protein